ncbi:hypothetical protein LZF95_22130 [Algoriphagus sp. AGSA1]|uniref:hypothetical protein n=1 Tax=Algoriphagus sp. AGSA1 TaxID=2907213 RepID=UPI001F45A403|nr:hypothetical protein [Algoriphagus sp. AGSA1]MCE7057396.1 hypothetical protein [Algoriphagus sp. AGSA1]
MTSISISIDQKVLKVVSERQIKETFPSKTPLFHELQDYFLGFESHRIVTLPYFQTSWPVFQSQESFLDLADANTLYPTDQL